MTKRKQLGWRVDRWVLAEFKRLCRDVKLRPSEAIERFMQLSIEVGNVEQALLSIEAGSGKVAEANEAQARVLLRLLRSGRVLFYMNDEELPIEGMLYNLLPKVSRALQQDIEAELKKQKED